jgi:hypothetical protein
MDHPDQPARYDIRVRGLLSDTLLSAFPELRHRARSGVTVLRGDLPDQAALHGVLARVEALGLELLEVRRVARRSAPSPDTGTPTGADGGRSTTEPPGERASQR